MAEEVQNLWPFTLALEPLCLFFAALRSQTRLPCVSIALHMLVDNIAELLPSS